MSLKQILIWSVVASCGAVLLLFAGTQWITPSSLSAPVGDAGWTGRTRAWFRPRGFQGFEIDPASGRQFSWTGPRSRLVFPHLDRSRPYRLTLDINAFRPPGVTEPLVAVSVDGAVAATLLTTTTPQQIAIDLPVRRGSGTVVAFGSPTFVPGGDARALGVMVNQVGLVAEAGHFRPDWVVVSWLCVASAAFAAGVLLCGVPALLAIPLVLSIVIGLVWLLLLDAAFLGDDVVRVVWIGGAVIAVGAVVASARALGGRVLALPEWGMAIGIVLGVSALKLACFTHPQIAQTDAMFQVHRAELVHRGEYFFTSVTPSPSFEFPYAILLYVTAQPFWSWFPSDLELANLLRGLALIADALVGLALYAIARRHWNHGPAALWCAVLWTVTRAPAMALGHANLTNLFGQGLFGVAMACLVWMAAPGRWGLAAIGGCVWLTLAFLSHFSTLTTGMLLVAATAVVWTLLGPKVPRRSGLIAGGVLIVAASIAYGLYYSHFNDLYRQTFTRIMSGADQQSDTSMVASPRVKWQRWITEDQFSNDYGLPGVALFVSALVGAVWLVRSRRREPMTQALLAWAAVWLAATALGILTSVELRANLAATPMFVCLAAYGLSTLASRSLWGRAAALVGGCAIAWNGVQVWLMWLGQS
ncbi:MAG: hypothetical protein ABI634_03405 [Acidobacteriota bacterium]